MLVLTAAFAGLRFGELAALTRVRIDLTARTIAVVENQIELSDGTLLIGPPKSEAGRRTIVIPDALVPELTAHSRRSSVRTPRLGSSPAPRARRCDDGTGRASGRPPSKPPRCRGSGSTIFDTPATRDGGDRSEHRELIHARATRPLRPNSETSTRLETGTRDRPSPQRVIEAGGAKVLERSREYEFGTGRQRVLCRVERLGCSALRQRGSHAHRLVVRQGARRVIPIHRGEDIDIGHAAGHQRVLAPGEVEGWLR